MVPLKREDLARRLDSTLLRADATRDQVRALCAEARELGIYAVCVSGSRVVEARQWIEESDVRVVTVVGFPLGAEESDAKRYEVEAAVDNGADEIDMVLNVGRLKDRDYSYLVREFRDAREAADGRVVKVILETCLLTEEEKKAAVHLALDAEMHFVKTSTGFAAGGATVEDVRLLREVAGINCGVKASGGIRDLRTAAAMLLAGASRIGTSRAREILEQCGIGEGAGQE